MYYLNPFDDLELQNVNVSTRDKTCCNYIHRVPEKRSHFYFRHNFANCCELFVIFAIFKAPCL